MITQFICLANSKKYNERCIAGVIVTQNKKGNYSILKENDKHQWIRPVTAESNGQVPSNLVGHINLLDIVEIDIEEKIPNGYQSENVLFKPDSLKVIGKIKSDNANIDVLADNAQVNIFGNWGKAVHQDKIGEVKNSLTLIRVKSPETYIRTEYNKEQYRLKFVFNSRQYDLPITDVKFIDYCKSSDSEVVLTDIFNGDIFVTISLGVEHEGFYYKLVAGIIQEDILKNENK
jgi:hypothetical protein